MHNTVHPCFLQPPKLQYFTFYNIFLGIVYCEYYRYSREIYNNLSYRLFMSHQKALIQGTRDQRFFFCLEVFYWLQRTSHVNLILNIQRFLFISKLVDAQQFKKFNTRFKKVQHSI
ncbi:hypothetical protein BDA99DRAFT_538380 [Phascolomyces articulosus]|uniref:Transmembrane protein n=1 Tax=Phascolomyces articulosus TaxID=60185 RepID=A0AAD5KAW3_9FUNG|nr:hypothetical protein BDA99DRAFT_538380 [Phascolomyces articulosus]